MKPHEIRRKKLLAVIEDKFDGNKGQFADFVGKKRPQIYRLFSDSEVSRRDIGEDLAREFEQSLDLPKHFLDEEGEPDTATVTKPAATADKEHKANERESAYTTQTPPELVPLFEDLKRAYYSKSLPLEAISSFRSLANLLAAQGKDIGTNAEADSLHLGLGAKRLAKSERLNHPDSVSSADKNDELDAD